MSRLRPIRGAERAVLTAVHDAGSEGLTWREARGVGDGEAVLLVVSLRLVDIDDRPEDDDDAVLHANATTRAACEYAGDNLAVSVGSRRLYGDGVPLSASKPTPSGATVRNRHRVVDKAGTRKR